MRQSEGWTAETKNHSCKKCLMEMWPHKGIFTAIIDSLWNSWLQPYKVIKREYARPPQQTPCRVYPQSLSLKFCQNCNWVAAFLWADKKQVLNQRPSPLPLNLKEWREKCLKRHFLWSDNVQVSFYWRAPAESSKVSPFRRTTHILNASSNDIV